MFKIRGLVIFIATMLMGACGPLVQTVRTPTSMSSSAECKKIGDDLFIDFRIAPIPVGAACMISFIDKTPDKLESQTENGYFAARWKVDPGHLNVLTPHFYNFKIRTPTAEYSISIRLRSTPNQIISATVLSFIPLF